MILLNLLFGFSTVILFVSCAKSPYKQCRGQKFEDLENRINVSSCGPMKCNLIKGTNTTVAFRFKPEKKVTSITNKVTAKLSGIPLQFPFVGVTGSSACGDVRLADSGEAAPCPLEPGLEYVYDNHFYIYPIYPETQLVVHWELISEEKPVICFEVPAQIVFKHNNSSKNKTETLTTNNTTTEATTTISSSKPDGVTE